MILLLCRQMQIVSLGSGPKGRPPEAGKEIAMSDQAKLFHREHGSGLSFWGPGDVYTFLVTG